MAFRQDSSQKMRQEMQNIINHAHALVDATSGELDDKVKAARSALQQRLDMVKGEYGHLENQLLDKVQAADKFIHGKPYYALGSTFAAGLLLGWIMSRE